MVKQRLTPLSYVCKRNDIQVHSIALRWLKQLISSKLNTIFRLQTGPKISKLGHAA